MIHAILSLSVPESEPPAREILAAQPHIVAATLGRSDGTVLASYRRAGTPAAAVDALPEPGSRYRGWRVTVTRPVMLDGRQIGTIALTGEPGDVWGRISRYLLIAGAVLATALGAAYALSTVLERIVSRPLVHLAATASEVSDGGDYSIRARRESSDEIGILVGRFNEMLDQIEQRDRALQEANELLEVKNAELERFTYTVSHDLKSPLVTIKGFLGMLERDTAANDQERVRHDIRHIHSAADKMQELLEELLHLSRIIHQAVEPEAVELDRLAREAFELVAGAIAERGVEVEIDPALPVVMGDRTRLREVYQNLLANAVTYMGAQPAPRIEVGLRFQGQETVFTVRDNGSGVDPRYRDKIFGLFERLETCEEGTGIGLAVVKRIVEMHGGRIWVESEGEGRGSTFCFTLGPVPGKVRAPG